MYFKNLTNYVPFFFLIYLLYLVYRLTIFISRMWIFIIYKNHIKLYYLQKLSKAWVNFMIFIKKSADFLKNMWIFIKISIHFMNILKLTIF